jgi:hypothetical protein
MATETSQRISVTGSNLYWSPRSSSVTGRTTTNSVNV